MTEPAEEPAEQVLSADEERMLDELRDVDPDDQVEAIEDRPEVERAVENDTSIDPGLLTDGAPDTATDSGD
jgi:hypothetical protein